jgi:hypothetical protein
VLIEHEPHDIRWWTLDELDASAEEFAPRRLPRLVREIVRRGPPDAHVDAGI